MNFCSDAACSEYVGEAAAWWTQTPLVGSIVSTSAAARAQCLTLNMPGNSESVNIAGMWGYSETTQPGSGSGHCTFWDGYTCSGNGATSFYPNGGPTCQPARSVDGWLWKSAKCWIN
ncbi:hypothetical protein C8F04DRAFT_1189513 [Mycena alexandri]|uniref:Uncharacterized protein n=1 Tax=Mycena alexandri TaxID=1745969 RepID=A0AAD6X0A1_9AGAR|nr:hypothetical protein C8F04DRAFT_1189513 [Mycena alexandri]